MNKIYRTWLLMAAVFFLNSCDDPNMDIGCAMYGRVLS